MPEVKGLNVRSRLPAILLIVLACSALPAASLSVELGVTGGGGMALMYGSLMDSKAQSISLLGSTGPGALGYSQFLFFPGWTAGAYAVTGILPWLALRLDAWYESEGAARTGFTNGGSPFDIYGVYFASVEIPLRAIAHFPLGPGAIWGSLGPYLGILASNVTLVDRYSSTTTTVVVTPDLAHVLFFGLAGGAAYSMRIGPGVATLEIRADWAILPVTAAGQAGGNLNPIGLVLVAGYGFQLGASR